MDTSAQLCIWDFDGVLSDSLTECLSVVVLAAFRHANPDISIDSRALVEIYNPEKVHELDRWMRPLRPFVATGQDYLWQYFHKDKFDRRFTSMIEYQECYRSIYNQSLDQTYKRLFYDSRKMLIKLMGKKYMSLFTTYQGAVHALRMSMGRHRSFVCTARDRQALEMILARHRIEIPRDRIYSQDFCADEENRGRSKAEQILEILDYHGGRQQPFVIVEDQVKAPAQVAADCPNMKVVFAAYGYGLASDWEDAGLKGMVQVNSPADLIFEIF